MGRLSEARKKAAKKKKSPRQSEAPVEATSSGSGVPPEDDAPLEADEVSPAEAAATESSPAAESPPTEVDDGQVVDAETASQSSDAAAEPSSGEQEWSLPASGLADDILAALSEPDASPAEKADGSGAAADDAGASMDSPAAAAPSGDADQLPEDWEAAWEQLASPAEEEGEVNLQALPSSGLAEEVLQIVGRGTDGGSPLSLDDIHEFESFYEEDEAHEQLQLVHFAIGQEVYALDITRVQEIIRVPAITRVPNTARHVIGVFNLRGRILAVFDLRRLLQLESRPVDKDSRIMVLDLDGKLLGLLIDRVVEVARVDIPDVEPSPEEIAAIDANLVTGVARYREQMVFLLDMDRVLALR